MLNGYYHLVGGIPIPLKNHGLRQDDDIPYIHIWKKHVPNHQQAMYYHVLAFLLV